MNQYYQQPHPHSPRSGSTSPIANQAAMFLVNLTSPAEGNPSLLIVFLLPAIYLLKSPSTTNLPLTPALSGTNAAAAYPLGYLDMITPSPRLVKAVPREFTIYEPSKASLR